MFDDPIVAEVRRIRDELARKFNYNVQAICEDLMRHQGRTTTIEKLGAGTGAAPQTLYEAQAAEPACVREGHRPKSPK